MTGRTRSAGLGATVAAGLIGLAFAGACTMDFDEFVHRAAETCTPNEVRACVGPGPCDGTQVCSADGKALGPCVCGSGGAGGSGGSSAGGSGGQ